MGPLCSADGERSRISPRSPRPADGTAAAARHAGTGRVKGVRRLRGGVGGADEVEAAARHGYGVALDWT